MDTLTAGGADRSFGSHLIAALLAAVALVGTAQAETRSESPSSSARPAAVLPGPKTDTYAGITFVVDTVGVTDTGPDSARPLPLIIGLHGLGDAPEYFIELLRALPLHARVAAARALMPYGQGYAWLPPSRPRHIDERAQPVQRAAEVVAPAITALAAARPTCGRPIVLGFSQGAMVTYGLAASPRPVLSAAFPIAGYLPPSLVPARLPALAPRIVALHGTADGIVDFRDDEGSVRGLVRAGYNIELRRYPGTGHTVSPQMRAELGELLRSAVRAMGCAP